MESWRKRGDVALVKKEESCMARFAALLVGCGTFVKQRKHSGPSPADSRRLWKTELSREVSGAPLPTVIPVTHNNDHNNTAAPRGQCGADTLDVVTASNWT